MQIKDLRKLLSDKRVIEEIHKHLWIESQKAGHSIGLERATDEWLRLYSIGWMKFNMPDDYEKMINRSKRKSPKTIKRKTTTEKIRRK